jgi:hypothetical protein
MIFNLGGHRLKLSKKLIINKINKVIKSKVTDLWKELNMYSVIV